ncbi:hypothetical protein PIB30_078581 [Stylosanthes scabra]|uniref:CCHC-type domain-containing protein n=1 Tax=Stylosanthes scabra TaxID=79078 RepID=A0ABU6YSA6_9FABA|nr:hypothetical protein [Stylosanthes scabra]
MELWMQMHDVPLSHMSRFTAETIGGKFGGVVEVEDHVVNNLLHISYLRTKNFMDIIKPLPTDIWMSRLNLPMVWISLRYERIRNSCCLRCGIIGHNKHECNKPVTIAS